MSDNKTIARNTIYLYIRMLFLMLVNIYTSRVVLEALGVEDYGIYNSVAGFIAMFSIVSSSISTAIARFITFVLGERDESKLKRVFSSSVMIQMLLAVIVVVLVEAIGVWFLNTKMTIPGARIVAANWVLQLALITFVFNLWSTPYNATLIAHERMSAFAFIGIFEGCANLGIAFLVMASPFDSLVFYAVLMCAVALATRCIYAVYCKKHFAECSFSFVFDKALFREMFSFAGWNFIGATSGLLKDHGINVLFNIYFGPVVNAAYGLASQVQTAVCKFSQNFFTAVNPQITKSYADRKTAESHDLVLRSSRLAFVLLMFFVVPIVAETDFILGIWLKEVPPHTAAFVQIILLSSMLISISNPMITLMLATGDIKKYQLVVGTVSLMNFPAAWLLLYLGGSAELALVSVIVFSAIALGVRLKMLKGMTGFPVRRFLCGTFARCLVMLAICFVPAFAIANAMQLGALRFVVNVAVCEAVIVAVSYVIGLTPGERSFVAGKIKSVLHIK